MSYLEKFVEYFNNKENFNKNDFIELELKLLIDPRNKTPNFIKNNNLDASINKCKNLFLYLKTELSCKNTQTINFINNNDICKISKIKELHFANGVQIKELKKTYKKERLHTPIYIIDDSYNFKISISSETNINEDISDYNLIRFKQRFTFVINKWNIDFTLIKTSTTKIVNEIKEIKDKLFINVNENNIFLENAWIWEYADIIEIEFEYNDINNPMQLSDINNILTTLNDSNDNTLNKNINISDLFIPSISIDDEFIMNLNNIMNPNKPIMNTIKKILPNAVEINKKQYFEEILPNIENFYITDKADGIRTLLIIDKDISYYNSEYNYVTANTYFNIGETIVECELINDIFYAYDIIKYDGIDTTYKVFNSRLKLLNMLSDLWPNLIIKDFIKLTKDYGCEIKQHEENAKNKPYYIDGIIFTMADQIYKTTKFYKWKPIKNMTIDFIAKRCPSKLLGMNPYNNKIGMDLYILFCGITNKEFNKFNMEKIQYYKTMFSTRDKNYFPIQFSPSDNPNAYLYYHPKDADIDYILDGKIIELGYLNNNWNFIRIREDRIKEFEKKNYYGNNFRVAELIWRNYSNPLTLDLICSNINDLSKDFYFKIHNSDTHKSVRKFNNMVKHELLTRLASNYTTNTWVIDLGCGKGQDLNKYINLRTIKNALFIDNNENNLCSIIERKYTYVDDKKRENSSMGIYIKNLDLNDNYLDNVNKIRICNPDLQKLETKLIVCNFAIHYFVENSKKLDNFIDLVDSLLPSGGRFLFTCLNGRNIYNLLKPVDAIKFSDWGDGKKYLIKPNFVNKKFVGGEEIDILLPFSDNTLYRESLVNLDLVESKFKKRKITLESQSNFGETYLELFKKNEPMLYNQLDDLDFEYIKLVNFSIYYKK